jgi:CheY-like chemotaxis protein
MLTVETDTAAVGEDFLRMHGEGRPGTYGLITVTDTGTGMDEQTRARIFEPFFTTKEMGKGTGLGLSTVYGIVKQSGGQVTCDSEPGSGTTFRVYLPAVPAAPGAGSPAAPGPQERGTETVLVAEDDDATRALIQTLFTDHGYRVITASDGEEALARLRERPDEIGLLLLDVIMPKRNGRDVLEAARKLRPDIPVLFMSGYTADIIQQKALLQEHVRLVAKPFTPDELLRAARDVLGRE